MQTYMHACIHTCMHAYICACMYTYVNVRTRYHTHARIHTCMHTHIPAGTRRQDNTHIHTYTHTHIHTYTLLHTYTQANLFKGAAERVPGMDAANSLRTGVLDSFSTFGKRCVHAYWCNSTRNLYVCMHDTHTHVHTPVLAHACTCIAGVEVLVVTMDLVHVQPLSLHAAADPPRRGRGAGDFSNTKEPKVSQRACVVNRVSPGRKRPRVRAVPDVP